MDNKNYNYRAFISYRHLPKDRKWAKWLLTQLETYRVPKALVDKGFPLRVGKVFRDDDEIPASSDLGHQLEQALRESEFLIVICSPDTPASQWVRREIALFQELGRGDNIIPLLISGEPAVSFPPELIHIAKTRQGADGNQETYYEDHEPLAADVRPRNDEAERLTHHRALIRITAALLHCRFDDLEQRDRQRQIKRQRIQWGLAATLLISLFSAVGYWWDYNRIKTEYYRTYITEYGVAKGIGPLDKAKAEKMNVSYALSYQHRQLVKMQRLTGVQKANPLREDYEVEPWEEGIATWKYRYDPLGQVDEVIMLNDKGKERTLLNYDFTDNRQYATVAFLSRDKSKGSRSLITMTGSGLIGLDKTKKSEITQHALYFDKQGHVAKRLFQTHWGQPTIDASGIAGRSYRYDIKGFQTTISFLDTTDKTLIQKNGLKEIKIKRDDVYNISAVILTGEDNKPVVGIFGYAMVKFDYDSLGNLIHKSHFESEGSPIVTKEGVTKITGRYDTRGNLTENAYFGINGKPTLHKYGNARSTYAYDIRGNVIQTDYFDIEGRLTLNKDGYARLTNHYDISGNLTEIAYFGIDGKPILNKEGNAKLTYAYDDRGNVIEQACFGIDGQPIINKDGIARATYIYDDRGNVIEQAYFGIDSKPILHKYGNARLTYAYDARGNGIQIDYFDIDGKPTLNTDGIARAIFTYDDRGNVIEQAYFGIDGKPSMHKDGFSKVTTKYDNGGNVIEQASFGIGGVPASHKDGYARVTNRYDIRGNLTERTYFGINGQPTLLKDDNAKVTYAYDSQGNVIEQAYFGIDGKPIINKDGKARTTYIYDDRGNVTEQAYFGIHGQLTINKDGIARATRIYDNQGNVIEQAYFGIDGQPIINKDGIARATYIYDDRGNVTEQAYFGIHGQLTINKDGLARATRIYDNRGNVIEQAYFGIDGQPVLNKDGYAKASQSVDSLGNSVEVAFYGIDGRLISRSNRLSESELLNTVFGNLRTLVIRGIHSTATLKNLDKGGYAIIQQQYNQRGAVVEQHFLDVNKKPVAGHDGFSNVEIKYNALGLFEKISVTLPGEPKKTMTLKMIYTPVVHSVRVSFVNEQNQLINNRLGFAEIVFNYDASWTKARVDYLDKKGKLVGKE